MLMHWLSGKRSDDRKGLKNASVRCVSAICVAAGLGFTATAAQAQQIICDGRTVQSLDFSGGTLTGGNNLQPGSTYSYQNVTAGVDARLEVVSFTNGASLAAFDNDAGLSRNLQPELIPNSAGGGFVTFRVSFFQAGTATPIALDLTATQIDVDGDNVTLREFVDFEDRFVEFTLNNPTNLDVNATTPSQPDRRRFEARTSTVAPGIDPTAVGNAVRAVYTNNTSFEFALGTLDAGATTRLTSLSFDCPSFTNPVTTVNNVSDLVTVKTRTSGNATPTNGELVTFQIEVTNNGPATASNVVLTDLIPAGLTATSNNGQVSTGSYNDGSGLWTIGPIAPNASVTLTIEGTVNDDQVAQATIQNITTAAQGDQTDNITAGDDLEEEVTVASNPVLELIKVADGSPEFVTVGETVTYSYTVTNTGNETVNNVTIGDVHNGAGPAPTPAGETLTTDSGTTGDSTDVTADDGVWSVLAPGDVVTFTGTYIVQQADIDNL
ncbi:MAG: DUF11 domain-containing protein [Erythrobacter sp.]